MKICVECKHYIYFEEHGAGPDSRMNHLCQASPIPKTIDPVTGKERPRLGATRYRVCADVNTCGKCSLWEPRPLQIQCSRCGKINEFDRGVTEVDCEECGDTVKAEG